MNFVGISDTAFPLLVSTLGVTFFGIVFGLLYKGIDRKLSAHMQARVGPPIRQPFRDVVKLFSKDSIVPDNAISWLFNLAPIVGLVATISILLYLPIAGLFPLLGGSGDLILILYLLLIPSLAMVIGGFSSGSPYATVGAQREMVAMMSYEFPLAITIIAIAWRLSYLQVQNVFALSTIVANPLWNSVGILGMIGLAIILFVLVLVTPGELSKIPFDAPEAETEIAGGLMVEYSGRNLAMFYLTDGVKTVVMASLVVALFFPYNIAPLLGVQNWLGFVVDALFYLFKVFLVILFAVTLVRVAVARLKIDQIVYTYWIPLTLASLVGLVLIMWDTSLFFPVGW